MESIYVITVTKEVVCGVTGMINIIKMINKKIIKQTRKKAIGVSKLFKTLNSIL